ncbi:MAG: NHLP bacteriocin export ABC transporter permease/ATPase subunit [Leptolyngbyaceae bacterium]|nr:NHLP bacteriocin export ABC transporter permease/ATPase subunit [Leptolyngbyaceae bacterium]
MQINGSSPLLLNQPHIAWMVESGVLAIFVTRICNGEPEGERRYLFNVNPGEVVFNHPLGQEAEPLGLLAVPMEATTLTPFYLDEADEARTEEQMAFLKQYVDGWIHKLGQVEGMPQPNVPGLVPEYHYISMTAGQVCLPQENRVLWIRMQAGEAAWMGYPDLPLAPELGCFPIGGTMCFKADDNIEFYARGTDEVKNLKVILRGLPQLHRYFLIGIERLEKQETEAAVQRFQARQRLNQQVTQKTIRSLAAVLQTEDDTFLRYDSPLLFAAGAVGKALGVRIEQPGESENSQYVKEPLEAIARASRLRFRRILLRPGWWQRDSGPILAYTCEDHHPVALLPIAGHRYEMLDPIASGLMQDQDSQWRASELNGMAAQNPLESKRVLVTEAIAKTLEPVAYIFYRPLPEGKLTALDLLRFTVQGRKNDVISVLMMGALATLVGMLVPQATAVLIDQAIPFGNSQLLVQMGVGLLAASFGSAAFRLAQAIASMRVETASDATLQAAVWDRLLKLRSDFFRQYSIGDLNSRVSGISAIRRTLSGTAIQSIFSGFFSLLNLGLLFYYSPQLGLLALMVGMVVMGVTIASGSLLIKKQKPLVEMQGRIYGLIVQLINGVPKLRIAGAEERAFAHWGNQYAEQLRLDLSTQQLEDWTEVFNTMVPTVTTVLLFWLATALIHPSSGTSELTTGTFLAFNVAFGTFIGGAASLSTSIIEVLEVVPLWQRSLPILQATPEVDANKADPGRITGNILVDHVTFRYREDGPLILDDVTVQAAPGEFIALVGPSGSGKSTILRLLLGFETPASGTVYYDGQDLSGLDVSAVRRQLGVVLQNGRISAGTIYENIAGGALISMDQAWAAAEMSGLADDLRAMPMELHTVVSEGGSNLSGGQRQRLVIARALALNPKILYLDEATSALDNRTQAIVTESLDRLNVTRIVVAHRLSTIRNADRIYVLEAGRVVQQGSFEQLAKQPGLFTQLIKRQLA